MPRVPVPAPREAQQVAITYVLAARLSTPWTMLRAAARQRELAAPALARRLAEVAPTAADVEQARVTGTGTHARLVSRASRRLTRRTALVAVGTEEHAAGANAPSAQVVISRVRLVRTRRGWRVTACTVVPTARTVQQALEEGPS
ncbi:hypothetical protein [Paraconexibacter sp. AEG42_29]|uniref:hypothetical protein n=1 Tax=Paraconexibacter sp. AEG42_29 TaxID=2997339 RepID=UPI00339D7883